MSGTGTWERRRAPRWCSPSGGPLGPLRVLGADDAELIEVSRFGGLFESWSRMRPGQWVRCTWRTHALAGRVLRCSVSQLADGTGVKYRAAMLFDPPAPAGLFEEGGASGADG